MNEGLKARATELVALLKQGAQISRERNLNLDYAKVADQAADEIDRLTREAVAADIRITNDAAAIAGLTEEVERLTPLQYRPAPCHKFCEATAYQITERQLLARIALLTAERDAALTAKAHAVQQAQIWHMEAVTQQAIVKDREAERDEALAKLAAKTLAAANYSKQRDEYLDERDSYIEASVGLAEVIRKVSDQRDEVLAKLAALAAQEPVAEKRNYPHVHMVGPNDGGRTCIEELTKIVVGTKLYAAAGAAGAAPMPDMFWNSDDAETLYSSIDEFLNDEICNGSLEVDDIRTIQQAKRLQDIAIKITSIDDTNCEAEWDVMASAPKEPS